MREGTHVDMTLTVLDAAAWKGDRKLAAKNAMYPDEVRAIEVEGLGAHVFGKSLSSLAHFCRPLDNEGHFGGYCWASDRSTPHLDLGKRKVQPHPEAWGFPTAPDDQKAEPLAKLVHDLTQPGHAGSIEADQMTYPTAAIMAEWCHGMREAWAGLAVQVGSGAETDAAMDTLAGWIFHFVQDAGVPHHACGVMLAGHAGFEGDLDERWNRWKKSGKATALLKSLLAADNVPAEATPRWVAEEAAKSAVVSVRRLRWCRCLWRPGWNKLVDQCIARGLLATVRAAKILARARW